MIRPSGFLVLAALILGPPPALAWQEGAGVPAAEGQVPAAPEPLPATPPAAPPDVEHLPDPYHPQPERHWIDTGHEAFSRGLFWPVERFDRFFADEREVDAPRARSFVRWRNQVRFGDDGSVGFGTSLLADLRFPHLSRRLQRLRLTLEGESREVVQDLLTPGDPPLAPSASGRLSAGLRLELLRTLLTQADVSAGLLAQLPVGLFTRLRLRHVRPVDGLFQVRTSSAGFWQTNTGWGVRQDLDLERLFGPQLLLRLANGATITQKSRGLEWLSELSLRRTFGERSAVSLTGSAAGATDAGPVVERYRLATRLRFEAFREWIFLELEPEGTWTRPAGGGRVRDLAVFLRVELQFREQAQRQAAHGP
jgi:hypothetical protein